MKLRCALILACFFVAGPASAQPMPLNFTTEELTRFATDLQSAVAAGKPDAIGYQILFPLRVDTGPRVFHFVGRAEFLSTYYRVFTPKVKAAILDQDLSAMKQTALGATFGNGVVTVESVCPTRNCSKGTLKIVAIDLRDE